MKHFDDTESLITVRDWLRFAVSRFNEAELFFGHGSDNAFDEAAYLILHTLHLPLDRLEPFLDASLTHGESEEVQAVIERRVKERIPAAYLTHEAWLGAHRFYVDERVIVPRSFIAELLHEQLAPWLENPEDVTRALDLCTGSGCLAILAALAFPNAEVDAVDADDWTQFIEERLSAGSDDLYAQWQAFTDHRLLTSVLKHTGNNLSQATRILGISRSTLRAKLAAIGISLDR